MTRAAYVSTYVPQRCGLATYTFHLRQAVNEAKERTALDPVAVVTGRAEERQADPLFWPLQKNDRAEYAKTARKLNRSSVDVVSLQHEFGIFGGEAGSYVLDLVRHLEKPLVTTFHTVFEHPQAPYAPIQREIAERSTRIIVMNRKAIDYLRRAFDLPEDKVVYIPHGTPEPCPKERDAWRLELSWADRKVLMTFGLLSRGKGIERIIEAMPEVVRRIPDALYVIVGQTHPEVRRREGEQYREELRQRIAELSLEQHVMMIDRYVDEFELIKLLTASDVYVTPYPGMQQITSGTLAYAIGLGRPVLTTPYSYAVDVLSDYPELLIPSDDTDAWARKLIELLADEALRAEWSRRIGAIGQAMHWPEVGRQHLRLFSEVSSVACAY